jgi:hypothetical protein
MTDPAPIKIGYETHRLVYMDQLRVCGSCAECQPMSWGDGLRCHAGGQLTKLSGTCDDWEVHCNHVEQVR